jgi:hypothetical protein
MTFSIMTLRVMTFSIMTLSIITFTSYLNYKLPSLLPTYLASYLSC